jgi:hypothetical protein
MFYTYIMISALVAAAILTELFREKNWKNQLAMVIILIPLLLRIVQIK